MASKKAGVNLPSAIRRALPWLTARLVDSDQPEAAIPATAVPATPPPSALPPPSDSGDSFAQAVAHLAYLGYEVGRADADGWSPATHPLRYNIHVRAFPIGLKLNCAVGIDIGPGSTLQDWRGYLNAATEHARFVQFSLFQDKSGEYCVRMRAWISGAYSRSVFAIFMDMWHDDVDLIRRKPAFPAPEEAVDIRATSGTIH